MFSLGHARRRHTTAHVSGARVWLMSKQICYNCQVGRSVGGQYCIRSPMSILQCSISEQSRSRVQCSLKRRISTVSSNDINLPSDCSTSKPSSLLTRYRHRTAVEMPQEGRKIGESESTMQPTQAGIHVLNQHHSQLSKVNRS